MPGSRDDEIYDRLAAVMREAAVAAERERQLEAQVKTLQDEMGEIRDLVSKGRGVLLVILSLGSLFGLLVGSWDKITRLFGSH